MLHFRPFSAGNLDLERYVNQLEKKISLLNYDERRIEVQSKRGPGPGQGQGTTGLIHLFKQIAVLDQLALLIATRSNLVSQKSETEKQVGFLASVLRGTTTFSQQQIIDLKQLLATISAAYVQSISSARSWEHYLHLRQSKKRAMDMSLPLQQLKTHWQMCMKCGELMFGLKAENTKCGHKGCDATLLKKPVFGFS
jgi:hypothetical protein